MKTKFDTPTDTQILFKQNKRQLNGLQAYENKELEPYAHST